MEAGGANPILLAGTATFYVGGTVTVAASRSERRPPSAPLEDARRKWQAAVPAQPCAI